MDLLTSNCLGELLKEFKTVSGLSSTVEPNKTTGLTLLRILNESQRRLSRTKHAYISGFFQTLVSNLFPMSERSGVNLRGEYNTNIKYVDKNLCDDLQNNDLNVEIKETFDCVDICQEYICHPQKLFERSYEDINKFKNNLSKLLNILKKESTRSLERSLGHLLRKRKINEIDTCEVYNFSSTYFPELFNIKNYSLPIFLSLNQVHYIPFVRYLLSSIYFILQNLSFILIPDLLSNKPDHWTEQFSTRILKFLKVTNTPPNKFFPKSIELISKHDLLWSQWKKNSCPIPDLSQQQLPISSVPPNKRIRLTVSYTVKNPNFVGIQELSNLWQLSLRTNEILKDPSIFSSLSQNFKTDLNDVLVPFLPRNRPINKSELPPTPYLWRCCRLALKRNCDIFLNPSNSTLDASLLISVLLNSEDFPSPSSQSRSNSRKSAAFTTSSGQ